MEVNDASMTEHLQRVDLLKDMLLERSTHSVMNALDRNFLIISLGDGHKDFTECTVESNSGLKSDRKFAYPLPIVLKSV